IRTDGSGRSNPATAFYTRTHPPLALLASVRRYSSSLAKEADRFAIEAMVRAGYDPREAERALAHLQATAEVRATQEPFWWGQASAHEARQRWVQAALAALGPEAFASPPLALNARYQQRTRRLLRENAYLEMKAGRAEEAIAQLGRVLRLQPPDAVARYYLGRAYAAIASTPNELRQAAE